MRGKLLRLAGGNALAQSFNYASLAVCLALYSPEGFGKYSVLQLLATLLATALLLRQDRVVLSLGRRTGKVFAQDMTVCQGVVAIAVGCISSYYFGWEGLWLGLVSALVNFNLMYQCYLIGVNRLTVVNISKLVQSVVLLLLQAVLYFALEDELLALTLSLLLSYTAGALYLLLSVGVECRSVGFSLLKKVFLHYRGVVSYSYPSVFLNSISNAAPTFLISVVFGEKYAGIYNMAYRLTATPLGLVSQAMMQLFIKHSAEKTLGQLSDKYVYFRHILNNAAIVLTIILFSVFFVSLSFSSFLAEWELVPVAALLLLPWVSEAFRVAPLQAVLVKSKYNVMELYFNVVSTAIRVGFFAMLYFAYIESGFLMSVYAFSVLSAVCWYSYYCNLSRKLAGASMKEILLGRETFLLIATMQVGWFIFL